MEGLIRIGHKKVLGTATGSTDQFGFLLQNGIKLLAVVGSNILDIAHVLVAPLDLERAHTGLDQRQQVVGLVVVFHRQQVFVVSHHPALIVFQCVRQTAGLGAVATVGAA